MSMFSRKKNTEEINSNVKKAKDDVAWLNEIKTWVESFKGKADKLFDPPRQEQFEYDIGIIGQNLGIACEALKETVEQEAEDMVTCLENFKEKMVTCLENFKEKKVSYDKDGKVVASIKDIKSKDYISPESFEGLAVASDELITDLCKVNILSNAILSPNVEINFVVAKTEVNKPVKNLLQGRPGRIQIDVPDGYRLANVELYDIFGKKILDYSSEKDDKKTGAKDSVQIYWVDSEVDKIFVTWFQENTMIECPARVVIDEKNVYVADVTVKIEDPQAFLDKYKQELSKMGWQTEESDGITFRYLSGYFVDPKGVEFGKNRGISVFYRKKIQKWIGDAVQAKKIDNENYKSKILGIIQQGFRDEQPFVKAEDIVVKASIELKQNAKEKPDAKEGDLK